MFLKSSPKMKYDVMTSAFFKELSKKKKDLSKKEIKPETESDVIAEIISGKLLEKIQKKIVI
jgi:Asp-tRNA(Asn)/Glu-tRNA(Gln) amidotransferase B subunit